MLDMTHVGENEWIPQTDDMRTSTRLTNGLIGKNYIMFLVNNFLSLLSATIVNNALF